MTLGGIVCVRNGDRLDYCWREAVNSLLPVCDMVTLCVASTNDDQTEEVARQWAWSNPKVVVCIYPWPEPKGDSDFWVNWMNYAREHCPTDYVLELDADEVLAEWSYPEVEAFKRREGRFTVRMRRHNFWRDAWHLVPEGVCLAHVVNRMGPKDCWLPSDGPHPKGAEWTNMGVDSGIEIFHYGFLRRRDAFFRKAKSLQSFFFDTYDPRLEEADKAGGSWMEHPGVTGWENNVPEYVGRHPELAKVWIKERNNDY